MRAKLEFNIGDRYGRVIIVKELPQNKHKERMLLCRCDCGHECPQRLRKLLAGVLPRDCKCLVRKTKTQSDREYWFRRKAKRPEIIIKNLPDEEWRDIVGYEGLYLVSNMGRVKGVNRIKIIKGFNYECAEKLLSPTGKKYKNVCLFNNGIRGYFLVHRLVAIAFIPNPENKPEVNHLRGYKNGDGVDNLEWATKPENEKHAHKMGFKIGNRGEKNYRCKLTLIQVNEIKGKYKRRLYTSVMLAKEYGVSQSHIIMIINGKHRKYG